MAMKYKSRLYSILLLLICALSAQAQLLWKVEIPGSKTTSYIFGTHHFAPVSMIDSVQGLRQAMADTERVIGEVDMKLMTTPEAMMSMQSKMMAPADSTLSAVLSPAQLDSLTTVWNGYTGGTPSIQMLDAVKPGVVTTQLSALQALKVLPSFNPTQGLDQSFQDLARKEGKEVAGLETVDFQFNMLFGKPISEQAENLMDAVRRDAELSEKVVKLTNAYMTQDLKAVEECILDPEMEKDDLEELIYSRNATWADSLATLLPEKATLVVVGAGHLPGDRGLLQLLRKKGLKVTSIK